MKQFFCALGSNLNHPKEKVLQALSKIQSIGQFSHFEASRLYLTSPVSDLKQPPFINAVCSFKSALLPVEVFTLTQEIEKDLGKVAKKKNEPRVIDIDLLYVEGVFSDDPQLILPHPELLTRLFVLKPLLELRQALTLKKNEQFFEVQVSDQITYLESFRDDLVILV